MNILISGKPSVHVDNPPMAESSGSSTIGVNIISLGSGEIIVRVIAFFGITYAARVLGPEHFGIIGFAAALFGYLSLSVTAGFADVGSREVARCPRDAPSIAASVIAVRLIIALLALSAVVVTVWLLNKPPEVKRVLLLMGLLFFPLALETSWVYKGLERNRPVAITQVIGQVLYVGVIFWAVGGPSDVALMPFAQFLGEISAALILLVPLFRPGKIKLSLRRGFQILKSSGFLAISRLLRVIMYTFDIVLIGFLLGEEAVGLYVAPYRICFLLVALAVAVYSSYLPLMTRSYISASPMREVGIVAERSLVFAAAIASPLVVGGIIVAEPLLVAIFGGEYAAGKISFQFLTVAIGFLFLHGAIHNIFLVLDRLKTEMTIFAVAAVVNVGLNIFVIPRYGIAGAAVVTALAEFVTLVCGLIVVNRIGVPFSILPTWRPILASSVMGVCLVAVGTNWGLFSLIGLGFGVYILALFALRGIPQDALPLFQTPAYFVRRLLTING